jgi:nucleoside-diphosphate-sugar epimerase
MAGILITGAGSFIGTNFRKFSENKDVKEISLHGVNPDEVDFSGFSVVLHLAAIVHQPKTKNTQIYYSINKDLAFEVAERAKRAGVRQFIFMSTIKVYGDFRSGSSPLKEDSVCHPDDAYGKSKYEAEQLLKTLADESFSVSIIRTPIVYGTNVKANMLRLLKYADNLPVILFPVIDNRRNYLYVENLVGFIDRIITKSISGTFIATDDFAISTTSLVRLLALYLGKKLVLFRMPEFLVSAGKKIFPSTFVRIYSSFELNNAQTKEILQFHPAFSTEEGIRLMVESYRKNKFKK